MSSQLTCSPSHHNFATEGGATITINLLSARFDPYITDTQFSGLIMPSGKYLKSKI